MQAPMNICVTCLSTDRYLVPVLKIKALLQEIHFEELEQSHGGVCWECWSILTKFYRLKNRAKQAQQILSQATEHINIKSLTTLLQTNIVFDCIYNFASVTNCDSKLKVDQDSVKEECLDRFDDYTDNTSDNDDKPVEKLEKIKIIDVELDVADNKTNDNLIGKQEKSSQDEKVILNETNEKCSEITIHLETIKTKSEKNLPKSNCGGSADSGGSEDSGGITKRDQKDVKVIKKIEQKDTEDEEFQEKFVQVVLSEEEMVRVREERRNHPSFRKLPHICHGCVLGFRKEEKYRIHMKKKHDEGIGNLLCDVCSIRFPHKLALNKHTRKHYVVYRCKLCKYEGNDLSSAVKHCKIKHVADRPDRIHCSQCNYVAKNQQDLEEHNQTDHCFWCNDCGQKFTLKRNIRLHMTRTHNSKRAFKCDICKKSFSTKMQLESHLARHNDNIAKKLSYCHECNIQYKNIVVYRTHLKDNSNHSEGYPCTECNKKFRSKSYLKRHYNFYHLRKSQYKCETCNKIFISNWRLRKHKQQHHGLSRPRNHSCNTCGKKFFTLATLRSHQFTHSDQRSFMCEDCGDTFKQKACLYTHTRLKHKGGGSRKKRGC